MSNTGHTINKGTGRTIRKARAFTLVEILVVIALTGLLLALVLGPLVQGFRLTNRARAYSAAQEAMRYGIEQLRAELSQAAYVYDNTNAPIVLPLGPDANNDGKPDANDARDPIMYPIQNGNNNPRPTVLYGKIDFVPSATRGAGDKTAIDPTTGKPLVGIDPRTGETMGGSPVAIPGSPGNRVIRYFIGLRSNLTSKGEPEYYRNVFEFPRTDSASQNLFILYRAEFDPSDPDLIDQTQAYPNLAGGFNDPNFFYNLNKATTVNKYTGKRGNGRTYAENWRDAAVPVLSTPNLDLIGWRRDNGRNLVAASPFQLNATFAPSTVLSDTATPGFLTNVNADAPGAVPTLYTAQSALWTYPFTVTVYRSATQHKDGPANATDPFGSISFIVEQAQIPGTLATRLRVRLGNSSGSLTATPASYWWLLDPSTGKIFIHTRNITLQLDASRGRVETAFAPFPVSPTGVPQYVPYGLDATAINLRDMEAGPGADNATDPPNVGSLFPLVFRQNSRADIADRFNRYTQGQSIASETGPVVIPTNQGILGTTLAYPAYYPATKPMAPFASAGASFASPFVTLGVSNADGSYSGVTNFRGILIAPGTETVLAPDNNLTLDATGKLIMNTYFRIPVTEALAKPTTVNTPNAANMGDRRYIRSGPLNYTLAQDIESYYPAPVLFFDELPSISSPDTAAGLPARSSQDNSGPQGEVRVSYLWQNNYSRDQQGHPLNTSRVPITSGDAQKTAEGIRPEADVIKLDYATRSSINVMLVPRVYDVSSGLPQSAQVNDKITVGNISR